MNRHIILLSSIFFFVASCGGGGDGGGEASPQNPLTPQITELKFPTAFPATIQLPNLIKGLSVIGLPPQAAYVFTYTATSAEITLLMVNNTNSSFVCDSFTLTSNVYACTGTVLGNGIVINASNFSGSAQTVVLDIKPSDAVPVLNQGSQQSPINIDALENTTFSGTLAANGQSYYQLNNLIKGSRYKLAIKNASDDVGISVFRDLFITDAQCDPNYLSSASCVFVSEGNSVTLQVDGTFAFAGASFDIDTTHLSEANEFEGTWYTPKVFDSTSKDIPRIGIVDNYNSYYWLTNLTSGRYYTLEFTSKTFAVDLQFFNPLTGKVIARTCNPSVQQSGSTGDRSCTFLAASSDLYFVAKGNAQSPSTSQFIFKLKPAPLAEGSISLPINLNYSGGVLTHLGTVDTTSSYYKVNGLSIGSSYLIRLSGNESLSAKLQAFDGDSSYTLPTSCSVTNQFGNRTYCIVTALSSDFYLEVNGDATPPGILFTLNITPLPVSEDNTNVPVASLPLAGKVAGAPSRYLISGLTPNKLYIAKLSNAIGILQLDAWNDIDLTIACSFRTRTSSGCLLDSGSNGNVNIRVTTGEQGSDNNEPGGFFNISMSPAPVLSSMYQSIDTPIIVPDNVSAGVNSQIVVSDSAITSLSNITVEVIIEHGYTSDVSVSLISPSGQTIKLVKQLLTSELVNASFNDYASENIQFTPTRLYNNTFRALDPMHVLNGSDPNGTWILNVSDGFNTNISSAFGGTLHAWSLSFE